MPPPPGLYISGRRRNDYNISYSFLIKLKVSPAPESSTSGVLSIYIYITGGGGGGSFFLAHVGLSGIKYKLPVMTASPQLHKGFVAVPLDGLGLRVYRVRRV